MNKSFIKLKNVFYKISGFSVNDSYNEQLSYDKKRKHFNAKTERKNETEYNTFMIDDLDYDCDGNQLKNVTDRTNDPAGFNDGNEHLLTRENDFEYDDYGNLTRNRDKKISNIVYNHLHLPVEITFDGGQKIEYLYTALGIKL